MSNQEGRRLQNLVGGLWTTSASEQTVPVLNPATDEILAHAPVSSTAEVHTIAQNAREAAYAWSRTPVTERIQVLFRLKALLEEDFDAIAHTITIDCGKTLAESRGELRRGIENVEVACGAPTLMQGYNNETIAPGIDEMMIRQPVGVVAAITPFNFPVMIPLWFIPYALACGNALILKPSEKAPLATEHIVRLAERSGLPGGTLQLVHGDKTTVDAIVAHPDVRAISFVGSTAAAQYVYRTASQHHKRVQCQGGAKNPMVILPDADMDMTQSIVADSAFGCAGQRCLAASIAITINEATAPFTEALVDAAQARTVGNGLDEGTQMGPVISQTSKHHIHDMVNQAQREGAKIITEGRDPGRSQGSFVSPHIVNNLTPTSVLVQNEIFGPVLSLFQVKTLDEAIAFVNQGAYGNMACLFTQSGAAARQFRTEAQAGNIGINLGVAAPMAFYPFSGWRGSFFGDLHAQGRDAIEFYTEKKVVVERWPQTWSRKF